MQLIADAVEDLPAECRDLAGNALLNVTAEAVAQDVGCLEAGRIFARLADLLARGLQPPAREAITLIGIRRLSSSLISSPVIRGRVGRGQASQMISENFRSEICRRLS